MGSSSSATGGGAQSTASVGGDQGTLGSLNYDASPATTQAAVDSGRPPHCDDAGHCSCFAIASIGTPGNWGGTTSALMNWLNTQSSAAVVSYTTKPTLDAAFLSQYDVIIVQLLADMQGGPYWTFAPAEITALSDWVHAGGGLITMSGYQPDAAEVAPLNQLLAFTDVSYGTQDILGGCTGGTNCTCWGGTVPVGNWAAAPIGQNITQIGAYHGRPIIPGSATIDAASGGTVYAAHEDIGMGHLFAWCDEWVTYTSQWLAPTTTNPACTGMTADVVFQVPQFWYNVIGYASQATQCAFTINNPMIIPR